MSLKPGHKAPRSGQYQQIGPRGGKGKEVTVVRREPLTPAPTRGIRYKLVDPTKTRISPARYEPAPTPRG